MEDKEFYALMDEKRAGISSMDITENNRENLYRIVDETIQRYEQNKTSSLHSQESLVRLGKALDQISQGLKQIDSAAVKIKENLPSLENTAKRLVDNGKQIKQILPRIEKNVEQLRINRLMKMYGEDSPLAD